MKPRANKSTRTGLAMVAVLLVLMALFVLCAPFLLTVRNADKSSAQLADRADARIALDSAQRHARAWLGGSHPALDTTPYHDGDDELAVTNEFEAGFLNASDPSGVMWDLEVEDVAGRIDLNSASPHVLANLLGGVARLTSQVEATAKEVKVNTTAGFLPEGFLWIDQELVGYGELGPSSFARLVRGVGAEDDEDGKPLRCRPQPPSQHSLGTYAIDQRMWAFARWRQMNAADGELGRFVGIEDVGQAQRFTMIEELGPDVVTTLERATSVYGGVRAGVQWQHGSRITGTAQGLPDYGCVLPLDEARHFNAGTTVMITDGQVTEFGLVQLAGAGGIQLMDPLVNSYEPYSAVVYPLSRRPVNINTASIEVLRALMLNLKLKGRSARLTRGEVEDLITVIVDSRPFDGLEDFMRRVVLPAAGLDELPPDAPVIPDIFAQLGQFTEIDELGNKTFQGFIDQDDARALYKNALNANDSELEFSTMPFAFTSRDVYRLELRASVNARSGIERARRTREVVELVVPQRDLMTLWVRQEDFDEAPRFHRMASFWMSGPEATRRFDPVFGSAYPTAAPAHLGPYDTSPSVDPLAQVATHVFPSREDQGAWLQLAPYRVDEAGRRAGRVLHFDDETRDLEGRYVPDGPVPLVPSDPEVQWGAVGGLLGPLSCELWIRPRDLQDGEMYLDLGGPFPDTDRVSLALDGPDLVLRVLDAAGDHPDTTFEEVTEVRYPLGEGPGLPLDVWTHVEIRVAGNRPDQVTLLVDGRWSVDTPGLTRLTGALQPDSSTIAVESTDGFPDECVLRIGDELIEVTKSGQTSFEAQFAGVGRLAGFGGRLAREYYQGAEPNEQHGIYALSKDTAHPDGAAVQLYGYSLPVFSNVPAGAGALDAAIGPFGVGYVSGIVADGEEVEELQMEPITLTTTFGFPVVGYGMDGEGDDVEGLVLQPADGNQDISGAFSPGGGYAAILGIRFSFDVTNVQTGQTDTQGLDINGTRLGGVEVVEYTGWDGRVLRLGRRGDQVALPNFAEAPDDAAGRGSYIFHYDTIDAQTRNNLLTQQVMVVPISLPVRGATGISSFLPASVANSEFAQITPQGQPELTEWVRYDEIVGDHLLRDDPEHLLNVVNPAAHGGLAIDEGDVNLGPGQPGLPGQPGNPGGGGTSNLLLPAPGTTVRSEAVKGQGPRGSYWYYRIGQSEILNYPVTRAISSHLQFRGVLGTHSHAQPAGTLVVPVFKVVDVDETGGRPGRLDSVMLFDEDPDLPGFPGRIRHAHRPFDYTLHAYDNGPSPLSGIDGNASEATVQTNFITNVTYVALEGRLNIPIAASANPGDGRDTRLQSRMVMYPSGERPRETTALAVGAAFQGGAVPSAVVDEVVFGNDLVDGQFVVRTAFGQGSEDLEVEIDVLRTPAGDWQIQGSLGNIPEDGGLLRIGDEIVAYDNRDAAGGTIHVPAQSRGLLGTDPQNHAVGASVAYLESWRVATLAGDVGSDDAELPIIGGSDFPASGTVLIDDELIHYTHRLGPALAMPRASLEPGAMDRKGRGIFRGRFGTGADGHAAGSAVIFFPFRYWDRWASGADAPELSFFEFSVDQPDAYWKRVFWDVENPAVFGPRVGVLQKTNPATPWDADPQENDAVELLWEGRLDREGNRIGVQSDRAAFRAFVQYEPGAYDAVDGLSHGWKTTPRLRLFGVEYMGPNQTLRRVDR